MLMAVGLLYDIFFILLRYSIVRFPIYLFLCIVRFFPFISCFIYSLLGEKEFVEYFVLFSRFHVLVHMFFLKIKIFYHHSQENRHHHAIDPYSTHFETDYAIFSEPPLNLFHSILQTTSKLYQTFTTA